jgi:NAD(P)-dependent dehydrogenase (short-subunit alcohol dehydrogenase family)
MSIMGRPDIFCLNVNTPKETGMAPHPHDPWNPRKLPDLTGRVALVTGANSGTGFEAAKALAGCGAQVILACRSAEKGQAARERILAACPGAQVEFQRLDLASLADIREATGALRARHPRLDLLLNNAGVMVPPSSQTADGFELQFGTNHLGHFALTAGLMGPLLGTPGARVVNMSSMAHGFGRMHFDDLQFRKGYRAWAAYGQSKLANLLFTFELARRLGRAGASTLALAAHPGFSRTGLQRHMFGNVLLRAAARPLEALLSQDSAAGAQPLLRAALDPDAQAGDYFGPAGWRGMKGPAVRVQPKPHAFDTDAQTRLWTLSEQLTGLSFPF